MTIRLQDDNPRPYFEKSENVTIQEHTPILNGILAKIKAYDRRDGVISVCDCLYLLDTDRSMYNLLSVSKNMTKFQKQKNRIFHYNYFYLMVSL